MYRQAPEVRVRQPRAPLLVDQLADGREFARPRQQRAELGMYREPRGAPEIGRRPLDCLAVTIYKFRDVFSSGLTDMGRAGLVKHTTDTGDQRPFRLLP